VKRWEKFIFRTKGIRFRRKEKHRLAWTILPFWIFPMKEIILHFRMNKRATWKQETWMRNAILNSEWYIDDEQLHQNHTFNSRTKGFNFTSQWDNMNCVCFSNHIRLAYEISFSLPLNRRHLFSLSYWFTSSDLAFGISMTPTTSTVRLTLQYSGAHHWYKLLKYGFGIRPI
jgi:hypothetical protein